MKEKKIGNAYGWKVYLAFLTTINGLGFLGGFMPGGDRDFGLISAVLFTMCAVLTVAGFLTNWWGE